MQVHSIMDEEEEPETKTPDMMIDSGSTVTLGKDQELFTDVQNLEKKVKMNTNGGSAGIDKEGCWRGYGRAYYMPEAMMNIVSLSDTIEKGFLCIWTQKRIMHSM